MKKVKNILPPWPCESTLICKTQALTHLYSQTQVTLSGFFFWLNQSDSRVGGVVDLDSLTESQQGTSVKNQQLSDLPPPMLLRIQDSPTCAPELKLLF